MNLFIVLLLTIFLEFIVYLLFLKENYLSLLGYSVLINCFTNPLSNIAFLLGVNLILIEVLVVLLETILLSYLLRLNWKKSIIISFIANLLSFMVGFVL
jgi:hypothetical protein